MSGLKPITLYSHAAGPNPWKVAIILEELKIPYEAKFMDMAVLHTPVYEKVNPNGRVPAIEDPNTGITLWESGAIIEYLIEKYDTSKSLTYDTEPEKYHLKQWLYFQTSGQGPYYGQLAWFLMYHPEKLPSVIDRYKEQGKRVCHVRNMALENKSYLVGDKATYCDLSFIVWDTMLMFLLKDEVDFEKSTFTGFGNCADVVLRSIQDYPHFSAWHKRLTSRPAVQKVLAEKMAMMSQGH